MSKNDDFYKKIIHSQADMSLKYLGKELVDDEFSRLDSESEDFDIPENLQNKLQELIKQDEIQHKKRRFYKSLYSLSKVSVIFFTVILIAGVFSYKNVSAFRYKFDNFISRMRSSYIELKPNDSDINLETITDIWLPSYIPEGYKLSYVDFDEKFNETLLYFENSNKNNFVMSYIPADNTYLHLDNEAESSGNILLNGEYNAYWSSNGLCTDICWLQSDNIFTIRGNFELEEISKIAESIEYV